MILGNLIWETNLDEDIYNTIIVTKLLVIEDGYIGVGRHCTENSKGVLLKLNKQGLLD